MADFRAETYKRPPPRDTHAERRQAALDLQRDRRAAVIEQFRRDASLFEELDLDEETSRGTGADTPSRPHPVFGTAAPSLAVTTSRAAAPQRDKFRQFANVLAWGTLLSAFQPLPDDLVPKSLPDEGFTFKPLPSGKRCLLVTYLTRSGQKHGKTSSHNALLLHRSSGHPMCRALIANCPPGCLLDCTYDEAQHCLWLIDVLEWHSTTMSESEASFRFWWLASKFDELGPQPYQPQRKADSNTRRLVLAHVPSYPLTSQTPLRRLTQPHQVQLAVLALSSDAAPRPTSITLSLSPCGLMLYHSASFYVIHKDHLEQDVSPLLYWIPNPPTHHQDALDVEGLAQRIAGLPGTAMEES